MPLPPPSCGVADRSSPRQSMRADWQQGCRSREHRGTRLTARVRFLLERSFPITNRLQGGIDFSQKKADFCLLFPDGQPLESHISFANSCSGYSSAKQLLLDALETYAFDGIYISGEATGYPWLPFLFQLSADPDLTLHDMDLHLLNHRWVKWLRKCFADDHKCDERDPFYIAERTRSRHVVWTPPDCLPLSFNTRLRFRLIQCLAREKCYLSSFLFLKASSHRCIKPFSNTFGVTSRLVLSQQPTLDELVEIPVEELAAHLYELSGHHLPDPLDNAHKLQRVAQESFSLDPSLALPVHRILELTLDHIRFLEDRTGRSLDRRRASNSPCHCPTGHHPRYWPGLSTGLGA